MSVRPITAKVVVGLVSVKFELSVIKPLNGNVLYNGICYLVFMIMTWLASIFTLTMVIIAQTMGCGHTNFFIKALWEI